MSKIEILNRRILFFCPSDKSGSLSGGDKQGQPRVCWPLRAFTTVCHFMSEACLGLQSVRENTTLLEFLLAEYHGSGNTQKLNVSISKINFSFLSQVNLQIGCTCPFRLGHREDRQATRKVFVEGLDSSDVVNDPLGLGLQTAVAQFWTQHSGQTFLQTLTSALGVSKTFPGVEGV